MFKVSKAAATEIKRSLQEHEFDDMPIRIAAQRDEDGSIHYQMGFDEPGPGDTMIATSGVDVVIAKDHLALLNGTEMDFAAIDSVAGDDDAGKPQFIFMNPNDPAYVAPDSEKKDSGEASQ
ncbi:MAG: hypothetical protein V3U76_04265 [Granulosicoccus sp.]